MINTTNKTCQSKELLDTNNSQCLDNKILVSFGKKVKSIENRTYCSVDDFMHSNKMTQGKKIGEGGFAKISQISDDSGSLCVMKASINEKPLDAKELNSQLLA